MTHLKSFLMLLVFYLTAAQGKAFDRADLAGQWQGNIPMVDHHHPITLTLEPAANGEFKVSYQFWDMTFVNHDSESPTASHISFARDGFKIVLKEAGMRIKGTSLAPSKIAGSVDWMGRSQPIVFNKINNTTHQTTSQKHNTSSDNKMNVAVLVFDGVDTLDWAGPLSVFDYAHVFNTYTVGATMVPFQGGAYQVLPDYTFENMPEADIVIVPGGSIAELFLDESTKNWLQQVSLSAKHVMSVCNASTLLAANGLLTGLKATTHDAWNNWLTMQAQEYSFTVVNEGRFVDNGKIITTAGVSSGIDGALHLVAKLKGLEHAKMTARMMEYHWQPEAKYKSH